MEPQVTVNGRLRGLGVPTAQTTALDWLRSIGLTGAKEGCAEGECGACAVLVARPDADLDAVPGSGTSRWTALNSCLMPALALDGQEVVTAEGLGAPDALHPVQREMAVRGGSQCGYCTPGFVCSMAAEYYRPERVAGLAGADGAAGTGGAAEVHDDGVEGHDGHECGPNGFELAALSGNLCRCTGYRPIKDAAYALGAPAPDDALAARRSAPAPQPVPTRATTPSGTYVRPGSLAEALELLRAEPTATVVAGSTDWGVEVNIRGRRTPLVVAIDRVPQLRAFTVGADAIEIGAALTLTEVEALLAGRVPLLDELFGLFASRLIRNAATLGGNLGTSSPIGDSPPALLALEADVVLEGPQGARTVPLAEYFTGYRTSVRAPGELIRAIRIPLPLATTTAFTKIAKRRYDDISSVAAAVALEITGGVITRARIGLGGVAATPVRALDTEAALEGRAWSAETVAEAAEVMRGEGTPLDDHRASAIYRSAMLHAVLPRMYARLAEGAVR